MSYGRPLKLRAKGVPGTGGALGSGDFFAEFFGGRMIGLLDIILSLAALIAA
jgi:hypothetical protein